MNSITVNVIASHSFILTSCSYLRLPWALPSSSHSMEHDNNRICRAWTVIPSLSNQAVAAPFPYFYYYTPLAANFIFFISSRDHSITRQFAHRDGERVHALNFYGHIQASSISNYIRRIKPFSSLSSHIPTPSPNRM